VGYWVSSDTWHNGYPTVILAFTRERMDGSHSTTDRSVDATSSIYTPQLN